MTKSRALLDSISDRLESGDGPDFDEMSSALDEINQLLQEFKEIDSECTIGLALVFCAAKGGRFSTSPKVVLSQKLSAMEEKAVSIKKAVNELKESLGEEDVTSQLVLNTAAKISNFDKDSLFLMIDSINRSNDMTMTEIGLTREGLRRRPKGTSARFALAVNRELRKACAFISISQRARIIRRLMMRVPFDYVPGHDSVRQTLRNHEMTLSDYTSE